jgi:hypothetical protein
MRIIEGWGHGFMQMASLMKEVDSVLTEMADWIDESFEKALETQRDVEEVAAAHSAAQAAFQPDAPVQLSPKDTLVQPTSTYVKPVKDYSESPRRSLGGADLGAPVASSSTMAANEEEGEEDGMISFSAKAKKTPPPSRYHPVPRKASREHLYRSSSAVKFDQEQSGSSGETVSVKTPPMNIGLFGQEEEAKGSGAFAFFNPSAPVNRSKGKAAARPIPNHSSIYGSAPAPRRTSNSSTRPASPPINKPTNSLLSAAVAGARAASPALAAAGLVPQSIGNVSEAELMRRRRLEAVFGMGETDSDHPSDAEEEDEEDEDDWGNRV